jgi:hypothetical protein
VALSDHGRVFLPATSNLRWGEVPPRTGERVDLEMKKLQLFGLAMVAMLAFSAFAAVSASAETTLLAEWLIGGAAVPTLTSVETTGTIELVNKNFLGTAKVLCEGAFDGSVGPNGEDEITEVLQAGVSQGAVLVAPAIDCTGDAVCSGLVEVWAENLPWLSRLVLMENGTILDELYEGTPAGTKPAYDVFCSNVGINNLCEGLATTVQENLATDVKGTFVVGSDIATCSLGNGETGGEGLTATLNAAVLAVSSE